MVFSKIKRLSVKIILAVTAVLVGALGLLTYMHSREREQTLHNYLHEESKELNVMIDATLRHGMMNVDNEALNEMVARVGEMEVMKRVSILDTTGKIIRSSQQHDIGKTEAQEEIRAAGNSNSGQVELRRDENGDAFMWALSPIPADKDCMTCHAEVAEGAALGYIGVERWATKEFAELRSSQARAVWLSAGTIALLALVLTLMSRSITRPVGEMAKAATLIARGDIEQQVGYRSADEIGVLAQAFRNLIDYIKRIAAVIDACGQGDLSIHVEAQSERDVLSQGLLCTSDTLRNVVQEIVRLLKAAQEGKLTARGDETKFHGIYRELVAGINGALDAVITPINEASAILEHVAQRNLTGRIEGDYQGDYLKIKIALNQATAEMSRALRTIGENAGTLASSSAQLRSVSHQLSASAGETSAQTTMVSASAEQVSKNVQTVATGAEEMGASIREIAKNAAEAAKVSAEAVKAVEAANNSVVKLGDSSAEVGDVVKMITSIAFQTNLLALNATIEAARAGEAGKGFAVVANEVKELAKATSKATENIGKKIEAIQGDTIGAVEAITQISGIIRQINDISNTIASAVEEQSVTTNEITRNIGEAASGSTEIAKNIASIMQAAQSTTTGATDTEGAAGELARMAGALQNLVTQFQIDGASEDDGASERSTILPIRIIDDAYLPESKERFLQPVNAD